ncbi:MAG TPA: alpha/beta hydrolase [Sphingomicrobium sp.]|nr:alpha/beta hydrolase [Sphingomicrobium sp.]
MKRALITIALLALAFPAHAAPGDDIYTRPGLIATASDGARLNLVCVGVGSPTVVFDSGYLDWSPAWATVQPGIAKFTRNCSYDRAGSGFSGPGPLPRTSERIATELHDALRSAEIKGPYILVGQAFGGDHVRAFADLFPSDVAGIVLVEADASDVDTPENRRDDDDGARSFVPLLKQCRDAIATGKTEFALPPPPGRPPRKCIEGFFRGLPEREWSPELNAKLLDIARQKVAMWDADLSELQETPADEIWLQQHSRSLGNTPVRVLTTGNHAVHFLDKPAPPTIDHLKMEYDVAVAQSHWLALSSDSRQIFVEKSGEYIQFDRPDVIVATVHEVYDSSRAGLVSRSSLPQAARTRRPQ